MKLDLEIMTKLFPRLPTMRAAAYLPHLRAACEEAAITTPARLAAFLAQLGHESADLRYFEEIASGDAYDPRTNPTLAARLGNTQPGDGRRYKGRGPIQLTGRSNYRAAGAALGVDLEGSPTLAASPEVGFRIAAWYWTSRGLNALADRGDFDGITRKINGGLNGKADRDARHARALAALGVERAA